MKQSIRRFSVFLVVFLASGTTTVWGDTPHYVAHAGQTPVSNYTSWATAASNIQDAVDAAIENDTVLVSNGVYDTGGAVYLDQTNRVGISGKVIYLQAVSTNPSDTLIVGGGSTNADAIRCVYVNGYGSLISGFTLTNGYAMTNGAGLYAADGCTISNCIIRNCVAARSGGGVYSAHATPARRASLYKSVISGNSAQLYGGGVYASPCVVNCDIVGNTSAQSAGGAYGITAQDCNISNNVVSSVTAGRGGGLYSSYASHCVISSNWSGWIGGGVFGSTVSNGSLIANNYSASHGGGAIDSYVYESTVADNIADGYGGGLSSGSDLARAVSRNSLFINNIANLGRGGGQNGGSSSGCVFSNNYAAARGGGAYSVTATNCFFYNNRATNSDGYGGGIHGGNAINSIFLGNTAKYGGGAYQSSLTNCMVAQNQALDFAGAVYGAAFLVNCTIVSNTVADANSGGAFYTGVSATNCVVWNNCQLSDSATNNWVPSQSGYSFAYTCTYPLPAGATNVAGNIDADPRLVDFAGGNYRLRDTSPCVNAGITQGWMTNAVDLDGMSRIRYLGVDMGAYETLLSGTIFIFR